MLVENRGYLICQDTVPTPELYTETSLPLSQVREFLERLPARVILLLVDACRAAPEVGRAGENQLSEELAREFRLRPRTTGQVRATFFACEKGKRAWEARATLGGKKHGYFGYHVAQGLRGQAAREGKVSLRDLEGYLGQVVPATAAQEGREQVPYADYGEAAMGAAEAVVLARYGLPGARLRVTSEPAGATVRVGGQIVGQTPYEGEVGLGGQPAKTVEVTVALEGYRTQRVRLPLRAGEPTEWPVGALEPDTDGPRPGEVRVNSKDGAEMVWLPGGEFLMGSPEGEGDSDEHPQHRVWVDGFWMYKYEVTVAQYRKFCEATGRRMSQQPEWNKDNHPVVQVSWNDATAYCAWAGVRLPTEAEWEYAARGGNTGLNGKPRYVFVWGDDLPKGRAQVGNLADETAKKENPGWTIFAGYEDGYVETAPVGSFRANGFGLHDMAGNVWEWCQDGYKGDFYAECARQGVVRNPLCNEVATARVLRGGSWGGDPGNARAADRSRSVPVVTGGDDGFRGARARLP